jgi:hypothetical protein
MQRNTSRNTRFHPNREPLRDRLSLELQSHQITGPFKFLNPTQAPYRHREIDEKFPLDDTEDSGLVSTGKNGHHVIGPRRRAASIDFLWRSRDNRKGRHALRIGKQDEADAKYNVPVHTATRRATGRGIMRMVTLYPVWDVSYLVAVVFTLGSIVWVINAFFVWLPLVKPATEFPGELLVGGGITAFIGATIFEFGSILLMIEAVNENRSGCFGWALRGALHDASGHVIGVEPELQECKHHHLNKKNLVGKHHQSAGTQPEDPGEVQGGRRTWQWFPSLVDLQTHYLHELGFLACLSQFLGASIFWISGLTALPGIQDRLSQPLRNCIYWLPQIIGGTGFIISGTLFMLETQSKWYRPAVSVLGWHIGFWNLVGAIGFTLCGALGPAYGNSGAEYEASLATFWGSWAFLIGSLIQWYESLDKFPVEAM